MTTAPTAVRVITDEDAATAIRQAIETGIVNEVPLSLEYQGTHDGGFHVTVFDPMTDEEDGDVDYVVRVERITATPRTTVPVEALSRHSIDRLNRLRRRRDYLTSELAKDSGYRSRSYDRSEVSALGWAIRFIEERSTGATS